MGLLLQQNTYIENQINNNIYITQNIVIPIPFDKEWNTDHIDIYLKQLLLLADNKYTDLLKKILENKNNLNVIYDKTTNVGYVYDSTNQYKNMEKNEIINLSMEKLYNQLNKIKDEIVCNNSKILVQKINDEFVIIEKKYNEYVCNKNIHKNVIDCISNIYDTKKDDAHQIFNNIIKNNDGY